MSRLELGSYEQRPYGYRARGVVSYGENNVPISLRIPRDDVPQSGFTYMFVPGWTSGQNSMWHAATVAVEHGHRALTLAHTNRWMSSALKKNADDVAATAEAIAKQTRMAAVGHSMGAFSLVYGALGADCDIERLTTVAPARHLFEHYYTRGNIVRCLWNAAREERSLPGDKRTARALGITTARQCVQRPVAIGAEFFELMRGNMHDELWELSERPNGPHLRILYGDKDGLFPVEAMEDSIAGLPYRSRYRYDGKHCTITYDPTLTHQIMAMDAQLEVGLPEMTPLLAA